MEYLEAFPSINVMLNKMYIGICLFSSSIPFIHARRLHCWRFSQVFLSTLGVVHLERFEVWSGKFKSLSLRCWMLERSINPWRKYCFLFRIKKAISLALPHPFWSSNCPWWIWRCCQSAALNSFKLIWYETDITACRLNTHQQINRFCSEAISWINSVTAGWWLSV